MCVYTHAHTNISVVVWTLGLHAYISGKGIYVYISLQVLQITHPISLFLFGGGCSPWVVLV